MHLGLGSVPDPTKKLSNLLAGAWETAQCSSRKNFDLRLVLCLQIIVIQNSVHRHLTAPIPNNNKSKKSEKIINEFFSVYKITDKSNKRI